MPSPANKNTQKHRGRQLFTLAVLLAWVLVLGFVALKRQDITDWFKLKNYQAPAAVAQLASQDTMTDYARHIFYVNHPAIEQKSIFSNNCPNNGGEQTIVLGCYHDGESGIFLLAVTDPRLDGVQQVTAAHEMLHGAYERLNASDRKRVDAMLLDYYNHDLHDPRILATMAAYKKTEPDAVVNEMHSVFGTEIANLPSGLEQYYARYFSDRSKVTGYAAQYQSEFTSREAAVTRDDAQLASLKSQINVDEADLSAKKQQIDQEQSSLTAMRGSGNIAGYNAGVPIFNGLVDAYNAEVQAAKDLVSQYNQLVAARNAVAFEEDQLTKDLSTSAEPIQK